MDVSIQIKRLKFAQNTIMIDCKTEIDNFFPFHTKKINLRVKSRRHIKNFKDFAEISTVCVRTVVLLYSTTDVVKMNMQQIFGDS